MALVRLNVGGQVFTTTESTLLRYPNSLFARLLDRSAAIPTIKDESGAIFIDRDPAAFAVILSWLRSDSGRVELRGVSSEALCEEARFYLLDALLHQLGGGVDRAPAAASAMRSGWRQDGIYLCSVPCYDLFGVGLLLLSRDVAQVYNFRGSCVSNVPPGADVTELKVAFRDGDILECHYPAPPPPNQIRPKAPPRFADRVPVPHVFQLLGSGDAVMLVRGFASDHRGPRPFDGSVFRFWPSLPPLSPAPADTQVECALDSGRRWVVTETNGVAGTTKAFYSFGSLRINKSGAHPIGVISFSYPT